MAQSRGSGSVPEAYASVSCAAAGRQEAMLVWGPRDGLNCRCVVAELQHWAGGVQAPDVQLVVVASRGNLPVIWGPLQATHLHTLKCASRAACDDITSGRNKEVTHGSMMQDRMCNTELFVDMTEGNDL